MAEQTIINGLISSQKNKYSLSAYISFFTCLIINNGFLASMALEMIRWTPLAIMFGVTVFVMSNSKISGKAKVILKCFLKASSRFFKFGLYSLIPLVIISKLVAHYFQFPSFEYINSSYIKYFLEFSTFFIICLLFLKVFLDIFEKANATFEQQGESHTSSDNESLRTP